VPLSAKKAIYSPNIKQPLAGAAAINNILFVNVNDEKKKTPFTLNAQSCVIEVVQVA
jgi:hypothetical protein